MAAQGSTPRRPFAAAASATLAGTAALGSTALDSARGPGGSPYDANHVLGPVTLPKWLLKEQMMKLKGGAQAKEAHPTVVFVLGGPGAGKGTMCSRVAEQFKYQHLSMGDLLRQERVDPYSDAGAIINGHIMQGTLVPADVTVAVLMKAMNAVEDWKHAKFIVDGFPRSMDQVESFDKLVGNKVNVMACLYFDCTEANLSRRLLGHADSDTARLDDTVEVIQKRIANFRNESAPIQRFFQYEGLLERIDANRDIEKVWNDVQLYFVGAGNHDGGAHGGGCHGSPVKAVWKLRDKQAEEMFPSGHSHTAIQSVHGPHARGFTSYTILSRHRDKHTRNMHPPPHNFIEPQTLAHEIGWHQPADGEHIGAKGTPRGMTTPRSFYPRSTCAMTRHMENMYSTNAQHIIRRW